MEKESVEKLLLKAFNWYYEERMWNTNISNEEALELFKETDAYQDFYNKESYVFYPFLPPLFNRKNENNRVKANH